jgi:hypothetical protein
MSIFTIRVELVRDEARNGYRIGYARLQNNVKYMQFK